MGAVLQGTDILRLHRLAQSSLASSPWCLAHRSPCMSITPWWVESTLLKRIILPLAKLRSMSCGGPNVNKVASPREGPGPVVQDRLHLFLRGLLLYLILVHHRRDLSGLRALGMEDEAPLSRLPIRCTGRPLLRHAGSFLVQGPIHNLFPQRHAQGQRHLVCEALLQRLPAEPARSHLRPQRPEACPQGQRRLSKPELAEL